MKKILCLILSVCFLFCTACKNNDEVKPSDAVTEGKDVSEKTEITLYYPDRQGISLVSEKREVEADKKDIAKKVIEKLIEGPQSDELLTLIPYGTKLNAVSVKDGLCTVDLSSEFIKNSTGGTASETLLVYSVVNSLTELEDIDEVLFLIDGETIEIFGNFIFDEPFEADEDLNK